MTSRADHQKKMDIIQQDIEAAYKRIMEKAENTLKSNSENYQLKLLEKITEELSLAREALQLDDHNKAERHRIRADVYKSVLDAIKR